MTLLEIQLEFDSRIRELFEDETKNLKSVKSLTEYVRHNSEIGHFRPLLQNTQSTNCSKDDLRVIVRNSIKRQNLFDVELNYNQYTGSYFI